jgi:hypothetical protein
MIPMSTRAREPSRDAWSIQGLIHERLILLGFAIDNSMSRTYSSHLNSYLNSCEQHHLPVDPTPDTLSFHITFMSHHIQPRSVEAYLSGIINNLEPYFPNVRESWHSRLVKHTLRGALHSLVRPMLRKSPTIPDDLHRVLYELTHP